MQAQQKKKSKRHAQRLPQDLKPRSGGKLGAQQQLLLVSGSPVPQLAYLRACSREDTQREEITDVVANTKAGYGIRGVSTKKGWDLSSMLDSLMARMKNRGHVKIEKTTEQ